MFAGFIKFLAKELYDMGKETGGGILAHYIYDIRPDGSRVIKPTVVEQFAPRLAKTKDHDAQWALILDGIPDAHEKALEEHFFPSLGPNQRAQFIMKIVEMGKGQGNEQKAHNFLIRMAETGDPNAMKDMALARRYIKPNESDYLVVKLGNALGRTIDSMGDLTAALAEGLSKVRTIIANDLAQASQGLNELFDRIQSDINNINNQNQGGN